MRKTAGDLGRLSCGRYWMVDAGGSVKHGSSAIGSYGAGVVEVVCWLGNTGIVRWVKVE
jgi:hypothetical protein